MTLPIKYKTKKSMIEAMKIQNKLLREHYTKKTNLNKTGM